MKKIIYIFVSILMLLFLIGTNMVVKAENSSTIYVTRPALTPIINKIITPRSTDTYLLPTASPLESITTTNTLLSWYGTFGMIGYNTTSLYATDLDFPYQELGFYSIVGHSFVGQSPTLTNISGVCFNNRKDEGIMFAGYVEVDQKYSLPLFYVHEHIASFNVAAIGQTFTIRLTIGSASAIGCNFLFENKQ